MFFKISINLDMIYIQIEIKSNKFYRTKRILQEIKSRYKVLWWNKTCKFCGQILDFLSKNKNPIIASFFHVFIQIKYTCFKISEEGEKVQQCN